MLNIFLPDQVQAFVEEQAKATGYDFINEYVYQFVKSENLCWDILWLNGCCWSFPLSEAIALEIALE